MYYCEICCIAWETFKGRGLQKDIKNFKQLCPRPNSFVLPVFQFVLFANCHLTEKSRPQVQWSWPWFFSREQNKGLLFWLSRQEVFSTKCKETTCGCNGSHFCCTFLRLHFEREENTDGFFPVFPFFEDLGTLYS